MFWHKHFPNTKRLCEHTFIADLLNQDSAVVDLGGNRGEFTRNILEEFGCKVYVLEPVPHLFQSIEAPEKVKKFNYGISNQDGPLSLHVPKNRNASIYGENNENMEDHIIVQGIVFDHFLEENDIKDIDLLKVDIEGAELDLFECIKKSNLQRVKQITVEFHDFLFPAMAKQVEKIKRKMTFEGFYCIPFSLEYFIKYLKGIRSLNNNSDVLFVRKDVISASGYFYLKYFIKYLRGIQTRKHFPRFFQVSLSL